MQASLEERLQHIVQHAYAHAPAVKALLDGAGVRPEDIRTVADLDRVPVTSKDRLAELQAAEPPFGGFLTAPLESLEHVFLSPGPLYEPGGEAPSVAESIRAVCQAAGIGAGDVVLNAFGYHLIPTGLALDATLTGLGATVVPAGVGNAELQLKVMADLGVTAYVGTPSWLMALLQKAEEQGMNFREAFRLEKALVSAEPLPPPMRQAFVERYGLRVTNAYGTAELGFLAYDNEGAMAMKLLETAVIQVVNPETGERVGPGEVGEVVVTTFNELYPLIRLGTGDLAMNVDPAPGMSRQGERAIILVGRVGEAVKVRGMFVHPNQLRFALGQVPGVLRAQAVVTREGHRDRFTLRVLAAPDADREALTAALGEAVRGACRVKVDEVLFVAEGELEEGAPLIHDERAWEA